MSRHMELSIDDNGNLAVMKVEKKQIDLSQTAVKISELYKIVCEEIHDPESQKNLLKKVVDRSFPYVSI